MEEDEKNGRNKWRLSKNFMKYLNIILILFFINNSLSTELNHVQNSIRFKGLERIYFQRVIDLKNCPEFVSFLLQENLTNEKYLTGKYLYSEQDEYQIKVHDFKIPIRGSDLWLREVRDHTHPRISKLWWAIYDKGRRSDTWHYTSYTNGTESKILSSYHIDSIIVSGQDSLTFRIWGNLARPGGYWQTKGIILIFSQINGILSLDRVQNVFTILHSYNIGDSLEIRTEKIVDDKYEQRALNPVTRGILSSCELHYLLSDEPWEYSWEVLQKGTFCITQRPKSKITYREFKEPSFIERGWKKEKK